MRNKSEEEVVNLIIQKRDELVEEHRRLGRERHSLLARMRDIDRELADCVAAARVFGYRLEMPEPFNERISDRFMRRAVHGTRAVDDRKAFLRHSFQRELPPVLVAPPKPKETAQPDCKDVSPSAAMPTVKDVALDQLEKAGPKGMKAAEIRQYIEETYDREIHEKTVGMTLYRLSRRNKVHREGRTWFFGPHGADKKNPGAATPGSEKTNPKERG